MERRNISLFWPLLLLSSGALLLLNNLGTVNLGRGWQAVFHLWPLLLVAGGLDSLFRRDGFVGPVLFTGVGVIFLLGSLGHPAWGNWTALLRYWPVLLIAFGLDVMIGRRRGWRAGLTGVLLGLALIGGTAWLVAAGPQKATVNVETFNQPAGSLETATIQVGMTAGRLEMRGGAAGGNLVEGRLELANGELADRQLVKRGREGRFILHSRGPAWLFPLQGGNSEWDLKLGGGLPLDALEIQLISGSQVLDLRGLEVEDVESETLFGRSEITLPDDPGDLDLEARVMAGELVLHIPAGMPVSIETGRGLTTFQLPAGYQREGGKIVAAGRSGGGAGRMRLRLTVPVGTIRIVEIE